MRIVDGALRAKLEAAQVALDEIHAGREPTSEQLADAPLLDAWADSEMGGNRICGFVEGHPTIDDGPCTTSAVIYFAEDYSWCRTISRYYRLGRTLERYLMKGLRDD
ncbi:hypothetical protein OF122_06465 [Pelagibacterium flavum]|uniref:Uncharacterized protein n=1 Tax=Pelagibacterium flavum TaxID=2984530 RepID=A0ABY6IS10_9HYPH|nr:DUF6634 family protein [Pelagibacterium sp. YIM 151497]UYQ73399.1 hypothetical protein OF122_06465 [Pelagibacterium sp. YIM 151497]